MPFGLSDLYAFRALVPHGRSYLPVAAGAEPVD